MRKRNAGCPRWLFAGGFVLMVCNLALTPAEQNTKSAPITELTLQRSPCFGTCPAYKITFHSDGSLVYVGERFVEHTGTFTAAGTGFTQRQFQRLVELVSQIPFDKLKPEYTEAVTDVPHTTATILRAGKRQSVESCCDKEPTSLWGYEMAFDAVLARDWKNLQWQQVDKKKP